MGAIVFLGIKLHAYLWYIMCCWISPKTIVHEFLVGVIFHDPG